MRGTAKPELTTPEDVIANAALRALAVSLDIRPILSSPGYHRLRREILSATDVPLPRVERLQDGVAAIRLQIPPQQERTHLELRLPVAPGERFVGFGERFNAVDQRGHVLENWVDDGAIGFGERLSPLLSRLGAPWNPLPKGRAVSYKPVPWFLSSRGYALLFEGTVPMWFDVAASDPQVLSCEVSCPEISVILFHGGGPAEQVQRFTQRVGRSPGLPDWALAPWNDAVGGQDRVAGRADLLRREKIPSSVIWTEDWGGARWQFGRKSKWSWYQVFPASRSVDRGLYPEIEKLARSLHRRGYKFLGYFYPHVSEQDPQFEALRDKGYLLADRRGETAVFRLVSERVAHVDLTHPGARDWYRGELREGLARGFDGWMADFGEYTPADVVAHDGESGAELHNRMPHLWAELNDDLLREQRPDGDFVFFSRSAAPGQQARTPVFWGGDSNTDFERWDGLPSNVRGLLSAGLSGFSVWSTDVGGYMSLFTRGRDAETLARWSEFAAFLPVMRTHHGSHPLRSVQIDTSREALEHYAAYARFHTALFPHLRALVDEAVNTGLPVCRPLLMQHPDDEAAWAIEDQFLLGAQLLVAPVLTRGASRRSLYLPAGVDWVDLWSGARHAGGTHLTAEAPIGRIPLFLRADELLATFDTHADTLVRRDEAPPPWVRTIDDAETSLAIALGPDFRGPRRLYDGTTIGWAADAPAASRLATAVAREHQLLPADMIRNWGRAGGGVGRRGFISWAGRRLMIDSPIERRFTVYAMGQPRAGA